MSKTLLTSLKPESRFSVQPVQSARISGDLVSAAPEVALLPLSLVNVYFIGPEKAPDRGWTLVDTGLAASASWIRAAAAKRFGPESRPQAIVLTHGHFDHVGSARALADHWDCPIYIHESEVPFVTGRRAYPAPDPTVGGGLMSLLSWTYPRGPYHLGDRLQELPQGGVIPGLEGWRWIPTPGHTLGHISLFRDSDGTLIAGDAFVTQKQESAIAVLTMLPAVCRPPAYYTTDWDAARESIRRLSDLKPNIALTGHGAPMYGPRLHQGLSALLKNWNDQALPMTGRYVRRTGETQVAASRRNQSRYRQAALIAAGIGAIAGLVTVAAVRRRS